jgi:hypothetical protein
VARARVQVRAVFPGPGEVSLFLNRSDQPARLLCVCAPPGQEQFFAAVGTPVASRPEPPPALDEYDQAAFIERSRTLAPAYRMELVLP